MTINAPIKFVSEPVDDGHSGFYEVSVMDADGNRFSGDELAKEYEQLQRQNDEQAARVARLEQAFKKMDKSLISMGLDGTKMPTINYQEMLSVFVETPQQSLAEIQAQAIEFAAREVFNKFNKWGKAQIFLNELAKQLRQQGKNHD